MPTIKLKYLPLAILFFVATSAHASGNDLGCKPVQTSLPPFFGSSVTGVTKERFNFLDMKWREVISESSTHITTENFRDFDRRLVGRISRNTLVRILPEFMENFNVTLSSIASLYESTDVSKAQFYAPVEILNPENIYVRMKEPDQRKLFVKSGDHGLVYSHSLNPIDAGYALLAKEGFSTQSNESVEKGQYLIPFTKGSGTKTQFEALECSDEGPLFYKYSLAQNNVQIKTLYLQPRFDGFNLTPIVRTHLKGLETIRNFSSKLYDQELNLADLESDYKGFIRLPLDQEKASFEISGVAFDASFVHYHGGDPLKSDTWGKSNTLCGVMAMASSWAQQCKGDNCTLQIGDIAFPTGAKSLKAKNQGKVLDPLGHATHHTGECVDIRPFRKDGILAPVTWNQMDIYDSNQTRNFLKFAEEFGAKTIYFNDPMAIKGLASASPHKGHDDHIHMCFYPPEKGGKNFCLK